MKPLALDPRVSRIEDMRRDFFEKRDAFSGRNKLFADAQSAIAKREPIPVKEVREYLRLANDLVVDIYGGYLSQFSTLPLGGTRPIIGLKLCIDARVLVVSLYDQMQVPILDERTAGATVKRGFVYGELDPILGKGFNVQHSSCGALAAAHGLHEHMNRTGTVPILDADLFRLLQTVPSAVALETDDLRRACRNGLVQAALAKGLLQNDTGSRVPVSPLVYSWAAFPKVEILSVDKDVAEDPFVGVIRKTATESWEAARLLGRDPSRQYATTVVVYDSRASGRVHMPPTLFAELPNGMLSVTVDAAKMMSSGKIGSSAKASVYYAAIYDSDHGPGHISGVGNGKGNRHYLFLHPDQGHARAMADAFLNSSKEMQDLTEGGKTFTLGVLSTETLRVELRPYK